MGPIRGLFPDSRVFQPNKDNLRGDLAGKRRHQGDKVNLATSQSAEYPSTSVKFAGRFLRQLQQDTKYTHTAEDAVLWLHMMIARVLAIRPLYL